MVRKKSTSKLLTEAELELMTILWSLGEATVSEVRGAASRELATTTVSTIMRILEQKGFLKTRKQGRGFAYSPTLTKEDYEKTAVQDVVHRVFDGEPVMVVKQLIQSEDLSPEEIQQIRDLLDGGGQ